MTTITKDFCSIIRKEMQEALDLIAKKYEVNCEVGSIRYNDNSLDMKISIKTGTTAESSRREWDLNCERYGLSKDLFGTEFTHQGQKFRISGWNQKARKNKIKFVSPNNDEARYHSSIDFIKSIIKSIIK